VAEDGRTLFFDPRQALPVLFEVDTAQAERARLDRARREEIELRLAKERGELIEADVPERWVVALAQNVRDRILGTPTTVYPEVLAEAKSPALARSVVGLFDTHLRRALEALADASASDAERLMQAAPRSRPRTRRRARKRRAA